MDASSGVKLDQCRLLFYRSGSQMVVCVLRFARSKDCTVIYTILRAGSRILVRGRGPEPKSCSKHGFSPYNCLKTA